MAKVVAVSTSVKKGTVKTPVPYIKLIENFGVEGDAHGGPGLRQVSFLGVESIAKVQVRTGIKGLCEGKFAENVTTEGVTLYELPIGTILKIGDAVLEVSKIGKECHEGCEISRLVGQCIMPKEGIFCMVKRSGTIKAGDEILIEKV